MFFENSSQIEKSFLQIIGQLSFKDSVTYCIENSTIFSLLNSENDFKKYIFYLQALLWIKYDDLCSYDLTELLYIRFKQDIENSQIDIHIKKTEDDIIFYPAGAKLLDQTLINDILDWIVDYKEVYNNFKNALSKYNEKKYARNIIDDMRVSLELLLKIKLNNGKSLENQKESIGAYLKEHTLSNEVRNMYITLIDYYCKYQNNHAKHNDNINQYEIEYIIYLTGSFMRLILTI